MIINRILDPRSKLSTVKWSRKLYNHAKYAEIQPQYLYRSLDLLAEERGDIKKHLYLRNLELFRSEVKVVFYDLTTIYFESEVEDELRVFGYSKDRKNDCVQVVLGVVLGDNGMPVTYDLYPGDTFEGNTVEEILNRLQTEYKIDKVIFVGDRGVVSEKALGRLEELGYDYVVAARKHKLSEAVKEEIASCGGWERINDDLSVKELEVRGRRLVLSKRYSKYLKVEDARIELDPEKIRKEEKLDGIFCFWCSKDLWQIGDRDS